LLNQFLMDFPETGTVGSYICNLSACTIKPYNIILFQFHVFGTQRAISKVKQLYQL